MVVGIPTLNNEQHNGKSGFDTKNPQQKVLPVRVSETTQNPSFITRLSLSPRSEGHGKHRRRSELRSSAPAADDRRDQLWRRLLRVREECARTMLCPLLTELSVLLGGSLGCVASSSCFRASLAVRIPFRSPWLHLFPRESSFFLSRYFFFVRASSFPFLSLFRGVSSFHTILSRCHRKYDCFLQRFLQVRSIIRDAFEPCERGQHTLLSQDTTT